MAHETHFVLLKITWQTGDRPVLMTDLTVHTFDENGVSGDLPSVRLSNEEQEELIDLSKAVVGYALWLEEKKKEQERERKEKEAEAEEDR